MSSNRICAQFDIIHILVTFLQENDVPTMHAFHQEVLLYKQNNALHLGSFPILPNQNMFVLPVLRVNYHHFCFMKIEKDIPR